MEVLMHKSDNENILNWSKTLLHG